MYVYTKRGRRSKSRKIAYVPNPAPSPKDGSPSPAMTIDEDVPLDPGLNRIVVVARDENRLTSSQTFVVHRRAAPAISATTPTADRIPAARP